MTSPHPPNTGMPENSILFAQMRLNGCLMNIMSSSMSHDFDFTAANSLVIPCASQEEIDHYWHHLGVGGNHSNCGWLNDKYGIFWQITPSFMPQIMADPSMCSRVIPLLRSMTKINIKDLFL